MSVQFEVDGDAFREFQRDLRRLEPDVARELNKTLRGVLRDKVLPAARSNASWSSRIPGAIKPQVTQKQIGLRVARKQAPHGRPFEGLQRGLVSRRGNFRHPVFGRSTQSRSQWTWVSQQNRPFLAPAFVDNHDEAVKAAQEAVGEAAKLAGFR